MDQISMDRRTYCLVSGTIFGIVTALHILRLARDWDVEVGDHELPRFVSYPGAIVSGALAVWGFQSAKRPSLKQALKEKFA